MLCTSIKYNKSLLAYRIFAGQVIQLKTLLSFCSFATNIYANCAQLLLLLPYFFIVAAFHAFSNIIASAFLAFHSKLKSLRFCDLIAFNCHGSRTKPQSGLLHGHRRCRRRRERGGQEQAKGQGWGV